MSKDENGLILPRKITNPCLQSTSVREVHRVIRWNTNKGINVLNNKSELEKVLAKQKKASEKKQLDEKEVENEFHQMLSERAKRLEQITDDEPTEEAGINKQNLSEIQQDRKSSASSDKRSSVIDQESEFARVFAQLRGEK